MQYPRVAMLDTSTNHSLTYVVSRSICRDHKRRLLEQPPPKAKHIRPFCIDDKGDGLVLHDPPQEIVDLLIEPPPPVLLLLQTKPQMKLTILSTEDAQALSGLY